MVNHPVKRGKKRGKLPQNWPPLGTLDRIRHHHLVEAGRLPKGGLYARSVVCFRQECSQDTKFSSNMFKKLRFVVGDIYVSSNESS